MKLVTGGPDLPAKLLQLFEDGRVVLFCGAGVSMRAKLPSFAGLVDRVYERTKTQKDDLEAEELDRSNFDRVLGLLETRIGTKHVRNAVIGALALDDATDLSTHRALLDLATDRNGQCRLVTTNFDQGFELASKHSPIPVDAAPKLPVPKSGSWNSVVHLHGRIHSSDPDGRSLVLTSADFGAAYLTERWASRFIADLFRRFTVLFVGYGLNDPVVRYMMDAFAADRQLGEGLGEAYALVGCSAAEEEKEKRRWKAKGLIPLLYNGENEHDALHETLKRWAQQHASGLLGKRQIILEHAGKRPTKPFAEDPVATQVLWALSETSGQAANDFADHQSAPPLDWLEVFGASDLLVPLAKNALRVVGRGPTEPLPSTARALARWLAQHLDKPELRSYVLGKGGILHPDFKWEVRQHLAKDHHLSKGLVRFWRIMAEDSSLIRQPQHHLDDGFLDRLRSEHSDICLRQCIIRALSPALKVQPAFSSSADDDPSDSHLSNFARFDVVLADKYPRDVFKSIHDSPQKQQILRDLADDGTTLLVCAMRLFEIVEQADSRHDPSHWPFPSIFPDERNEHAAEWTVLIELSRDAWIALHNASPLQARGLVERWRSLPYPVFRRLAFFAMTTERLYTPGECFDYLLENDGYWLWSPSVSREKLRLLLAIWPTLEG